MIPSPLTLPQDTPPSIGNDPFAWAEISRITALPVVRPMDDNTYEEFNRLHVQGQAFENGFRLDRGQAEGLAAYEIYGSCFAKLPVGSGKTLLGLSVANAAYRKGLTRMLLFCPPEVLTQLTLVDIPWARSRIEISYPIHVLGGKPKEYRTAYCKSGRKGLYILPYSYLSTTDTSENLKALAPHIVIADEAHRLSRHGAARTRRFMAMLKNLFDAGNPAELVIMSGTITSKSIKDYYHLIKWCLHEKCPLPLSDRMAGDWAQLIDAQAASPDSTVILTPSSSAPIIPVVEWARKHFPQMEGGFPADVYGFRRAYQCRFSSAPGVVSAEGSGIGTSLVVQNTPVKDHKAHRDWAKLQELMEKVEDMWLTPNGDEIDFGIHKWKWLNELSAGFYNELTWPTADVYAARKKIDLQFAQEILLKADIHHQAGQAYAKILRTWLEKKSKPGCDTPFLCGQSMVRFGDKEVGPEMYTAWKEWKDLDFDGRPDRDSRAVRVCDYKIAQAVRWAQETLKEGAGGIIWVHHQEIGTWLCDAMREAGLLNHMLHAPAGEMSNTSILDHKNKDRIVVASIAAHGTGKNLQHFSHMNVVQWPRDARVSEQLIGRLHRRGQEADELVVQTNHTTRFDMLNFAACLNDSLYIHQTTGDKQKLIYASYDPTPVIFPDSVLIQKGLDARTLDRQQKQMMVDKFGDYANLGVAAA